MPSNSGGASRPICSVMTAPQSPPCATNFVYPRRFIRTIESPGLNSLVPLKPPKQRRQNGPGKKEWLYDYAMSRLPYHPQYVRSRTRFDAELQSPLIFGSEMVTQASLA